MKKYTIQEIEAALDIVREAIPGITIPKINYGTAVGGAAAPAAGATNGATWGTNLSAIPDIVAALVTGILGAWNVTNFNLRSGGSDADSAVLLDPTNSQIRLGATTGDYITLDGILKQIISSNYAAGVSGFKISPDLIEAENINARGTLRGATFANNIISAIGGQLMVANASSLAEDMTAADNSTLTIKDDTTFAVNDILVMRSVASTGVQEEWLRVTSIASAPTYTVTRDLAGSFSSNANPIWKAGTPVVKQGSSNGTDTYSGGWLRLIGEGTNSPYYSVYQRTGLNYNDFTEVCRLGNLNGFLDYSSNLYGIGIGDSTASLSYDTINGLRLLGVSNKFFVSESSSVLRTNAGGWAVGDVITWTKYKEIKYNDSSGVVKVRFGLLLAGSGDKLNGRIYVNGSAVGTTRLAGSYVTYSYWEEDISVNTGDLIQIYCSAIGGGNGDEFQLKYDKKPVVVTNDVNL